MEQLGSYMKAYIKKPKQILERRESSSDFHTSVHSAYRKSACGGELAGALWKLR